MPRASRLSSFTCSRPELELRLPRRLLRGEAGPRAFLRLEREMRLQFLVEVLLHGAAMEEGTEPVAQVGEKLAHGQVIPSTSETAVVSRCQSSASTLSCLRPARVSS